MAEYTSYFTTSDSTNKPNSFPVYELSNGDLDTLFPLLMQHSHSYELEKPKKRLKTQKETSPYTSDEEEENIKQELLTKLTRNYEKPLRLTKEDKALPLSVLLNTGVYKLPPGFSCALSANFSSRTPTGMPDVIIKGSGNASGSRSWSGIIFEGVNYSSNNGKQQFYNCIFRAGSYIKLDSYGEFINCTFICDESERTPLEINKNVRIFNCNFEGLSSNIISYINFKSECTDPSYIQNSNFDFIITSPSTSARRRFSPILISGSNPLFVSSSLMSFESDNAEVILFSSCSNTSPVSLTVNGVRGVNRLNNAQYCAVLSNLWSNGASISFSNCIFEGIRMVLYGALRCSHFVKCALSDSCSHTRKVDSDWKQLLVITNTTIKTESQNGTLIAAFDLSNVESTVWSLSFINSFLYVNRANIPFNIVNAKDISLSIIGSSFVGDIVDPTLQQPWLNLNNVGNINIITSPSSSFINLAPATRSGTIGNITITNAGGLPLSQTPS